VGDRVYTMPIDSVTFGTAASDVFTLMGLTVNGIVLHHIHLEANVAGESAVRFRLKRLTATAVTGSGGAAGTPVPVDPLDAAVVGTYRIGDTAQATTSGSTNVLAGFYWDVALPFDHLPAPEDRERCSVLSALVFENSAVIVSTVISGYVKFALVP
jgi:hypothetical protein